MLNTRKYCIHSLLTDRAVFLKSSYNKKALMFLGMAAQNNAKTYMFELFNNILFEIVAYIICAITFI